MEYFSNENLNILLKEVVHFENLRYIIISFCKFDQTSVELTKEILEGRKFSLLELMLDRNSYLNEPSEIHVEAAY